MIEKSNGFVENGVCDAKFSPLVLKPTNDYNGRRRIYELDQDFTYLLTFPGGSDQVTVPAGYKTDLATLPVVLQVILGNRDDYAEEAIIHDWLCDHKMPRFYTNARMRSLMYVLGRPYWKQRAVFYGLMLFGYGSWIMEIWNAIWTRGKKDKLDGGTEGSEAGEV